MSYLADTVNKFIHDLQKEKEQAIINFLTSKGYRPKRTEKYIKGLIYRLKKKGLKLVIFDTPNKFIENKATVKTFIDIVPLELKDEDIIKTFMKASNRQ